MENFSEIDTKMNPLFSMINSFFLGRNLKLDETIYDYKIILILVKVSVQYSSFSRFMFVFKIDDYGYDFWV